MGCSDSKIWYSFLWMVSKESLKLPKGKAVDQKV